MRDVTVSRNYAEALLELARRAEDLPGWGKLIQDVANAMQDDATLKLFLESPKVSEAQKSAVITEALSDRVPRHFLRFMLALIRKRRQMLIPEIATEYFNLVDVSEGRVHANVTVAREPSETERNLIAEDLSRVLGKQAMLHVNVNPAILGGVIVKVGDTVMDGSVRKRLGVLRSRLLARSN
ncbi:MAG TPA: ATP synthase F1 subunit delta [Gemmatimonadaceae bacterium]|nr:ATP synthase F1 subunit delta [Gemmatimonadaceae bacterium]